MKSTYRLALAALLLPLAAIGCSKPTDNAPEATVGDAIVIPEAMPAATEPAPVAAPSEPAAAAPETPAEPQAAAHAEAVYTFNQNTYIGFAGSKPTGTHYGQFTAFTGGVTVLSGAIESAKIDLEIDTTSISTDDTRLTGTLKNESWFDIAKFPTATFESASIVKSGGGYTVTGNLTMKGVTKGVSFPATITLDGDTLKAKAEFSIDRNAWTIGVGLAADVIVDDAVAMELDVEAVNAAQ